MEQPNKSQPPKKNQPEKKVDKKKEDEKKKQAEKPEPPKPLTAEELQQLLIAGNLFSFCLFHHSLKFELKIFIFLKICQFVSL